MDCSQTHGTGVVGTNPTPGVTVDQVTKLLKSAQPLVWSLAIVLGLLGVTLTIRYFWKTKRLQDEPVQAQERAAPNGNFWVQT